MPPCKPPHANQGGECGGVLDHKIAGGARYVRQRQAQIGFRSTPMHSTKKPPRRLGSPNMMHSKHSCALLIGVAVIVAVNLEKVQANVMYGGDFTGYSSSQLLTVNTTTGAGTSVGTMGSGIVAGLAFDRNSGTLYGANVTTDELVIINTTTGAQSSVGALGIDTVGALAFDPNTNVLYGVDNATQNLLVINTTTGAASSVGAMGSSNVAGLAFDPNSDTLYGTDIQLDVLVTINTSTAAASTVGSLGFEFVAGLTYDPDTNTLFGVDKSVGSIVTINTTTGAATTLGSYGATFEQFEALAFESQPVPEPSTFVLVALGLLSLGMARCRRPECNCGPH